MTPFQTILFKKKKLKIKQITKRTHQAAAVAHHPKFNISAIVGLKGENEKRILDEHQIKPTMNSLAFILSWLSLSEYPVCVYSSCLVLHSTKTESSSQRFYFPPL